MYYMHVLHVCIHVELVLLLQDTTATTKRTVGIKVSQAGGSPEREREREREILLIIITTKLT